MQSTSPKGTTCHVRRVGHPKLTICRHPKIIEDEKAIEVVLRLEETSRSTAGADEHGRRFTVTAVGSRLSSDHRRSFVTATSIAAGDSVATPPATEQRKSSEARRSSGASLGTIAREEVNVVVPTRTVANSQYTPHLEAIQETRPNSIPRPPRSRESGYFS